MDMHVGMYLFGGFWIFAGLMGLRNWYSAVSFANSTKDWPSVTGRIIRSELSGSDEIDEGEIRKSYSPVVEYEYEVKGKKFSGDTISIVAHSTTEKSDARSIVNRYKPGSKVFVYYDPEDNCRSVLDPEAGVQDSMGGLIVSLALFVLGFIVIYINYQSNLE